MRSESPERTVLRLRSAAGHLWAVGTWLEEGADPVAVLAQLAAVQAALEAARRVLIGGLWQHVPRASATSRAPKFGPPSLGE